MADTAANAPALHRRGVIARQSGDNPLALELIGRAIAIAPSSAMLSNLAAVQAALGDLDGAVASCRAALALDPDSFDARCNLGSAFMAQGKTEQALIRYHEALALEPAAAEVHYNIGNALRRLGQLAAASSAFRQALALQADHADAHNNLGLVLKALGQADAARASFAGALAAQPHHADALVNLGNVLKDEGQLDAAADCYRKALARKPGSAAAHNSLGIVLHAQGRLEQALASYGQALALQPDFTDAVVNLALLLLYMGRFEQGWNLYRARTRALHGVMPPVLPFPEWQGEPLDGKSLLIWPEQGLGDEIQFCRYVAVLKRRGARHVTLVCKRPLVELLRSLPGVDAVLPLDAVVESAFAVPPHDHWVMLLNLPFHCRMDLGNVPTELPYLRANPARAERLAQTLAGVPGLKVGLCWKAGKSYLPGPGRSFGLATFQPLFDLPGVRFFSLQPGTRDELLQAAGAAAFDLGHEIDALGPPFEETAALIMQLDLVIGCDASIGHLAAALGKPVWTLLPAVADWRWLATRDDSPWYPRTRLFRRQLGGDWADVMQRVADRLRPLVES